MDKFADIFGATGGYFSLLIFSVAMMLVLINFWKNATLAYHQLSESQIGWVGFFSTLFIESITVCLVGGWYTVT